MAAAGSQQVSEPGRLKREKKETEHQEIQKRQSQIEELKRSRSLSQEATDREKAEGLQVFSTLKESVERSQEQFMATITEKQRKTEEQAEGFIRELEEEISELEKRSSEGKKLPLTKDWTRVSVPPPSYKGTMMRSLSQLEEGLSDQMEKVKQGLEEELELKKVKQYAVDLTLDPAAAHPKLILSDDGKQVQLGDVRKELKDSSLRFNHSFNVLAKESFSEARFYFEVQVKGKTQWTLGVARESISRKGAVTVSSSRGFWAIRMKKKHEYTAQAVPPEPLSLKHRPEKVGVFVDYEEGLVSFYDADTADLIYSFTGCDFTERLYPFFSPGRNDDGTNSDPLVITPVRK